MVTLRHNEPLSKHTSWRVGGVADAYCQPDDLDDLVQYLRTASPTQPLFWLGLGSNILVRDGGIRGTVIAQSGKLNALSFLGETRISAEVGVSCAKLSRFAKQQNLGGLEFLSGIPGSVGGALAMNAGAFGGEIWPWVESVTTINAEGILRTRTPADYEISYRHVTKKTKEDEWFVSAIFVLDTKAHDEDIKALLKKRNASQPIGLPSCGSVFKNPKGHFAAQLIEVSDLKGFCIGKACVSEKHANFIINTGDANATDIEALILHIQQVVLDKHAVTLEPEVRIVGECL